MSNCRLCFFPGHGVYTKYLNIQQGLCVAREGGCLAGGRQVLCFGLKRWNHVLRTALDCASHQRLCEINNTCKYMQIPLLLNIEVLNMLIRCILIL